MQDALSSLYASLSRIQDATTRDVLRQHADAIAFTINQSKAFQSIPPPKQLTLAQIKAALQASGSNPLVLTGLPGQAAATQFGTHLARPAAANVPIGTFYLETDRTTLYANETIANVPTWAYVAGVYLNTAANRPTDLGSPDAGFLFYATDKGITYRWSGTAWTFKTELGLAFEGTHIARVASGTLGTNGTVVTWASGDKFDLSWADLAIVINGVSYVIQSVTDDQHLVLYTSAGVQAGVAYLGGYLSYQFGTGVGFYETNRTVSYITAVASGMLTTTGTAVAWVSGDKFNANWVGASITIAGTSYVIAAVASNVALTLALTAGNQVGVAYSVAGGKWLYASGTYYDTFANRPTGLTVNDIGLLFAANDQNNVTWRWQDVSGTPAFVYLSGFWTRTQAQLAALAALLTTNDTGYSVPVSDYHHTLNWTGAAWQFVEGDASGYVLIGQPGGTAPMGGLWGACDGTAYNVLKSDGTLVSLTTQNLTGNVFVKGASAVAAQRAADSPTWAAGAKTDGHTHDVSIANNAGTVLSGPNDVAAAQTVTSTSTQAGLSDANAVINPPSETNHGLPLSIAVVFWMRR